MVGKSSSECINFNKQLKKEGLKMAPNVMLTACLTLLLPVVSQGCSGDRVYDFNDETMCISRSECFKRNYPVHKDVCVPYCPDDASFVEISTGTCLHECPFRSVRNGTKCLRSTLCSDMNQKVFNRACVSHCPNGFPLEFAGVCYESCPANTVVKGSNCVPNEDFIPSSNETECPDQSQLFIKETNACASTCPDKMAALNRSCISDYECIKVHGLVVHDSSCINTCPSNTFLHDGFCKLKCPQNSYINGSVCETGSKCIDKGNSLYNLSCIGTCPQEAPIKQNGYCVSAVCSETYVLEHGQCISLFSCVRLNKFIHDGTCVAYCPDTHPFIRHHICTSECPDYTIPYLNLCMIEDKCWRMEKVVHDGRCLDSCPDTHPIPKGFGCSFGSVCPPDYLLYNDRCIGENECTKAMQYVSVEGQCAKACSVNASYLHVSTRTCFSKCPIDTVVNGSLCIDKTACTSNNQLIHNNTCVDSCPVDYPYNASWVCHEKCPNNTFPDHQICRPKSFCINSGRYMHEGKCINRCPYPEEYVYDGDCIDKCPEGTKRLGVFCRDAACNESFQPLFDGQKCISKYSCEKIQFEGGCVDYCPYDYFRFQDGCRELPNILHPVSGIIPLIMICIVTLVIVLYEPEPGEDLYQIEEPVHDDEADIEV